MIDKQPKKADWSGAYPHTHEQYMQQTSDYVDQQHRFFEAQKAPGHIPAGWEQFVSEHVPPNSETALRAKWKMINGDAPYPEAKS